MRQREQRQERRHPTPNHKDRGRSQAISRLAGHGKANGQQGKRAQLVDAADSPQLVARHHFLQQIGPTQVLQLQGRAIDERHQHKPDQRYPEAEQCQHHSGRQQAAIRDQGTVNFVTV